MLSRFEFEDLLATINSKIKDFEEKTIIDFNNAYKLVKLPVTHTCYTIFEDTAKSKISDFKKSIQRKYPGMYDKDSNLFLVYEQYTMFTTDTISLKEITEEVELVRNCRVNNNGN